MIECPFEVDAYNGYPIPENMTSATDIKCYTSLRNLYWNYRDKKITREAATAEKKKILDAWELDKSRDDLSFQLGRMYQALEGPFVAFRKDPTVENAKALYERVYRMEWR